MWLAARQAASCFGESATPPSGAGQPGGGVDDRSARLLSLEGLEGAGGPGREPRSGAPTIDGIRSLPLEEILRSRKRLRRQLLENPTLRPLRVAVLGGTTTNELVDLLELLLLSDGFRPTFHQSEYNRFYEDATLDVANLAAFKPDVVYLHTHFLNVSRYPSARFTEA